MNSNTEHINIERYCGVKGWLLLFCMVLIVIQPAIMLINIYYLIKRKVNSDPYLENVLKEMHQNPSAWEYISLAILIAIISYGVHAGILLYKENIKGVKKAKIYLIMKIIYGITASGILFIGSGMNLEDINMLSYMIYFKAGVNSAIGCIFWYSYLIISKRVKYTYGY